MILRKLCKIFFLENGNNVIDFLNYLCFSLLVLHFRIYSYPVLLIFIFFVSHFFQGFSCFLLLLFIFQVSFFQGFSSNFNSRCVFVSLMSFLNKFIGFVLLILRENKQQSRKIVGSNSDDFFPHFHQVFSTNKV